MSSLRTGSRFSEIGIIPLKSKAHFSEVGMSSLRTGSRFSEIGIIPLKSKARFPEVGMSSPHCQVPIFTTKMQKGRNLEHGILETG